MNEPIEFERHLINLLFTNPEYQTTVWPYLRPEVFDSEFSNGEIYNGLCAFCEIHDKFPTKEEFDIYAGKQKYYETWRIIRNLDSKEYETEFVFKEIETFVKQKLLLTVRDEITRMFQKGLTDNLSVLQDKLSEIQHFSFNKDVGLDPFSDPEEVYNSLFDDQKKITTGLESLDDLMKGGFYQDSLTLFIAATNCGKTAILCHIAASLLIESKNILYISLEENRYRISQRIFQNLFNVNQEELKVKQTFMNAFEKVKQHLSTKLYIVDPPDGELRCDDVIPILKELKEKKQFEPDLILIDYIGCMRPNRKTHGGEKNYELVKAVVTEVKALCRKLKMTVVSAAQLNRGGAKSENPELSDLADAFDLAKKTDFAWMMYQDQALKLGNLMRFTFVKSRIGNKDKCVNIVFDDEKQRFKDEQNWKWYYNQNGSMVDKMSLKQGQANIVPAVSTKQASFLSPKTQAADPGNWV